MDLETRLRDHWATVSADVVAVDPDLVLRSLEVQGHRRSPRWLIAGVAASVAAIAVVASTLAPDHHSSRQVTDPSGFLVPPTQTTVIFPLTATHVPNEIENDPTFEIGPRESIASWNHNADGATGSVPMLVYVSDFDLVDFKGAATTFEGRPATLGCDTACYLTWQRAPEQWVAVVLSRTPVAAAEPELRKIAAGLTDTPVVHHETVRLGLVPAQCSELLDPSETQTQYITPTFSLNSSPCPVKVQLLTTGQMSAAHLEDGVGEGVSIGGREGWLEEYVVPAVGSLNPSLPRNYWRAVLKARDGRRLVVTVPLTDGWTRDELDRFIEAIDIG